MRMRVGEMPMASITVSTAQPEEGERLCFALRQRAKKMEQQEELTHKGEDNNNEIKNVPQNFEVMPSETQKFDNEFAGKDDDEHFVDDVVDFFEFFGLFVAFHAHDDSVQHDDDEDDDVEFLIGDHAIEEEVEANLQGNGSWNWEHNIAICEVTTTSRRS